MLIWKTKSKNDYYFYGIKKNYICSIIKCNQSVFPPNHTNIKLELNIYLSGISLILNRKNVKCKLKCIDCLQDCSLGTFSAENI